MLGRVDIPCHLRRTQLYPIPPPLVHGYIDCKSDQYQNIEAVKDNED